MLMLLVRFGLLSVAVALAMAGQTSAAVRDSGVFDFGIELVADGFDQPVQVVDPGDGSGRLFVVEQPGRIRIVQDGQVVPEPFLDITDLVGCCGERGLLGLAFHPDYAKTGEAFVNYTDRNGDTVVARYQVSTSDPNRVDPTSAETILTIDQPAANHNGGLLLFGPKDDFLYIGLGDGGGGNGQNGQDLSTLLGKFLRIDVDRTAGGLPYA
ncbi:MAG: glucose/sorbosone dehydrogenase-like protein, partial [Thermomicrobiales bacterium]|nr:glucose/sorbosone dehydrogenase-like protein [Thermomicrobiales bacterium]